MPKIGLPRWLSGKESTYQCRRHIPGSGSFPWRKKWQPTPIFLSGKSPGQRNLRATSPWGQKESDVTKHALIHVSDIALNTLHAPSPFISTITPLDKYILHLILQIRD